MARDPAPAPSHPSGPTSAWPDALRTFRRPWPILLAGLACTVLGLVLSTTSATPVRVLFLCGGLLLAGSAVARRLQTTSWELEDRVESAGLVALGAFVALLTYLGTDDEWDSAQLFLVAVIIAALGGALLILLPRLYRRIIVSLLVVLHFGGILTACTAVAPQGEPAPWLSMQLWTRFYRPYLTFMYLVNAYHFYSPDPGPPQMLWFRVEYADHSFRWIKMPVREENLLALHYQRQLALTESVNQPFGLLLSEEQLPEYEARTGEPHESWNTIFARRTSLGPAVHPEIQMAEDVPVQYNEPASLSKRLLASYARYIARTSPHPDDPEEPVANVRIYRVTHRTITPPEIAEGKDPLDPTMYLPYYMGKFNPEGELLDPKDPFLYWYLPIAYVDKRFPEPGAGIRINKPPPPSNRKLLNCVEIHAGDVK